MQRSSHMMRSPRVNSLQQMTSLLITVEQSMVVHMKTSLLLSVILFINVSVLNINNTYAEVTLTASNNISYTFNDQSGGQLITPNEIEDWPRLCIRLNCAGGECASCDTDDIYDVRNQASTLELSGRQRLMATQSIHNLNINRRVFVPNSGQQDADGFIRFFDTLENPTLSPITVSVRYGTIENGLGHVGHAGSQIWRTSTYDANLSVADRWLVIDDQEPNGGDLNVALLLYGSGGVEPSRVRYNQEAGHPQALYWDYDSITIPARSSVALISLIIMEEHRVDALDEVRNLLRLRPVDATFGLSNEQLDHIINADLDPRNASPLADLNGPYNGVEGSPLQISATSSFDLEEGDLIYLWDFDNDGIFGEPGDESAGANVVLTFPQNGEYPIALQVEDPGGKTDFDQVAVNIRNADPTLLNVLTNSPIDEGSNLDVQVEAIDIGVEDVLTYEFDWGMGAGFEIALPNESHRYQQDGVYNAQIKISDQDGGEVRQSFTVTVNNLPPVIQQVLANNPAQEGTDVQFIVQAYDPGSDPLTYSFDFDEDGVFDEVNSTGIATYTFFENGSTVVLIKVQDDQNAETTTQYPLSILNTAPSIDQLVVSDEPYEGRETTITVTASDLGLFDRLTYAFDLDGISGYEIIQPEPVLIHSFDDNGRKEISIKVSDDDGGFVIQQATINVGNLPPEGSLSFEGAGVNEGFITTVDQGVSFEVVAQVTDPSSVDQQSLSYYWDLDDDGIYEQLVAGRRQTLQFDREGFYLVRCLVRDKDLGESVFEREMAVAGRAPQVLSFEVLDEGPYLEGELIRFRLNASDPDPITYRFDFDGDDQFEIESDDSEIHYTFPNEGRYNIIARAEDESGY